MYNKVVAGTFRDWLIAQRAGLTEKEVETLRTSAQDSVPSTSKSRKQRNPTEALPAKYTQFQQAGTCYTHSEREVRNMRLDNKVMQLRKICCHPYLLDWPTVGKTDKLRVDRDMVRVSGKMRMLDQILDALLDQGHRVLIFSQVCNCAHAVHYDAGHLGAVGQRREALGAVPN